MIIKKLRLQKDLKCKCLVMCCLLLGFVGCFHFRGTRKAEILLTTPDNLVFKVSMPKRDKIALETFFRYLIIEENFGYTLLGKKPVSISSYRELRAKSNVTDFFSVFTPRNMRVRKGWRAWRKYNHLFENRNYAFWAEQSPWIDNGVIILIANKKSLYSIIRKHALDFQDALVTTDLSCFWSDSAPTPFFKVGLRGHEGLIGTVLGYGRNNAWLFSKQRKDSGIQLQPSWESKLDGFKFKSFIKNNFSSSYRNNLSLHLTYPIFVADLESEETNNLKEEYLGTYQTILDYYKGKDFLGATLSLLKYGNY